MRIKVRLGATPGAEGDAAEQLRLLAATFSTDPLIQEDSGGFYLSSTVIDEAETLPGAQFYDACRDELTKIQLAAATVFTVIKREPVTILAYEGTYDHGTFLRIGGINVSGYPAEPDNRDLARVGTLFQCSELSVDWARLVALLGRNDSLTIWYDLWGVYDILRSDLIIDGTPGHTWLDSTTAATEREAFKVSANTFALSGSRARHQMASKSSDAITRVAAAGVMTPSEARNWLTDIVLRASEIECGPGRQ